MATNYKKIETGVNVVPKSASTSDALGDVEVLSSTNKASFHNGSSASPIVTEAHSATLTNKTIDADSNTITNIDNADIKTGAAIDRSKLATATADTVAVNDASGNLTPLALTSAQVIVGNASGVPTATSVTGDVTISNTGVTAIAANVIVDGDISTSADITRTKLAPGTADHVLINDGTGEISSEANLAVSRGGTGAGTLASNNVLLGNGTSALQTVAPGTSGNVLTSNGTTWTSAAPIDTTSAAKVINAQTGTTYTFALTDGSNNGNSPLVTLTNASVVTATVPPNSSVAFPIGSQIDVIQGGAGSVIFAPGAGVTINSPLASLTIRARYSQVSLIKTATNTWDLFGDLEIPGYIVATGGTITTDGNFKIHTFTSSGTFQITSGSGTVESLVVGGGGGGGDNTGSNIGAGGGGGGVIHTTPGASYVTGSYSVTVGAGGAANSVGGSSTFDTITAGGGGDGGQYDAVNGTNGVATNGNGGGGGGGSASAGTGGSGNGAGFAGGNGAINVTFAPAGGGGGAGAAGGNASAPSTAGNGGAGVSNSITGAAVTYAGGGGGGVSGGTAGTGGAGGGGNGSSTTNGSNGTNGLGGGGGGSGSSGTGGTGGDGVVILRYQFQ